MTDYIQNDMETLRKTEFEIELTYVSQLRRDCQAKSAERDRYIYYAKNSYYTRDR